MTPRTARARVVTDLDVALLRSIARERSVVAASRAVGISRDRATYRLRRMAGTFRGAIVSGDRGGRGHGGTRLTPLGDRIAHGGFAAVELLEGRPIAPPPPTNVLAGRFRAGPPPEVELRSGGRLRVAFSAEDGAPVAVALDPEAILVARGRFASSARNVLAATVERVPQDLGTPGRLVTVRAGRERLGVALTTESVRGLGLARGRRVYLYVKATALRRVARPTRGSLPR